MIFAPSHFLIGHENSLSLVDFEFASVWLKSFLEIISLSPQFASLKETDKWFWIDFSSPLPDGDSGLRPVLGVISGYSSSRLRHSSVFRYQLFCLYSLLPTNNTSPSFHLWLILLTRKWLHQQLFWTLGLLLSINACNTIFLRLLLTKKLVSLIQWKMCICLRSRGWWICRPCMPHTFPNSRLNLRRIGITFAITTFHCSKWSIT